MEKKKIILIIVLLIITLVLTGLLISKKNSENNQEIVQTNKRNVTVEQVEITNDYINIRKENDSQSEAIGKVYKGEIYTVLDRQEDEYYLWYQIETTNGIKGYIAVKYLEEVYVNFLEITEESTETPESTEE